MITSKRPTTYSTFDGTGNDGKNIFFFYFDGGILNHIKPWAKDPAWKQITQSWILATPSVHLCIFICFDATVLIKLHAFKIRMFLVSIQTLREMSVKEKFCNDLYFAMTEKSSKAFNISFGNLELFPTIIWMKVQWDQITTIQLTNEICSLFPSDRDRVNYYFGTFLWQNIQGTLWQRLW